MPRDSHADQPRLTYAQIQRTLDELYRGPVSHPLAQVADHFGAECRCMHFPVQEPWRLTLALSGVPQHPSVFADVLHLRGAYCDHPQLPGWRLFELPLPERVLVVAWPPSLTDRELGDFLRREAARSASHDRDLISIAMPHRDCQRCRPPIREA